jgi:protein-L-isoaspartate(D-aspartate) O-methyltransferase
VNDDGRPASAGIAAEDAQAGREAEELRAGLVNQIIARQQQRGQELPDSVQTALRAVPRHLFTPGVPLTAAYQDDSLITKTNERGVNVSAVSAPSVIAGMLTQLGVSPGQSVLEIGSGGYNAALLQELTGPDGSVTTLDIDAAVIARARICLDRAGYRDVRTICADAEFGAAGYGPFDKIIVTAGAWDIPPAWTGQLAPGGRIVVPLRTRGLTRSWALDRDGGHLASRSHVMCGFVPFQGAGEHRGRSIPVDEAGVGLWTDELTGADTTALAGVLASERAEIWSGVTAAKGEPFDDQDLHLITLPDFCQLTASQDAIDQGTVTPSWRFGTPALVSSDSLAYRARLRPVDDARTVFEFGAYGHGPHAAELAERLSEQIRIWDRDHRGCPGPVLTVHPAGTPAAELPAGYVLNKHHTTLVLTWAKPAP